MLEAKILETFIISQPLIYYKYNLELWVNINYKNNKKYLAYT